MGDKERDWEAGRVCFSSVKHKKILLAEGGKRLSIEG